MKDNQGNLHADMANHVADQMRDNFYHVKASHHETEDEGHGKVDKHSYYVLPVPDDFEEMKKWARWKGIGLVISETLRDGKIANQVRYYIMSRKLTARKFGEVVRGHWGIENQLHWQLDVSYQEDKCRVRNGHADAKFAILRRLTLNILQANKTAKVGIKNKTLKAGWDSAYCELVL